MRTDEKIVIGVGVALIVVIVLGLASGYRECRAQGGDYVRGALWMTCINRT